jgi:3-oxoacyl-(acyl-carrier-protein) synthase/NADP-dependent 3-hydroxy acid dehydrogenase YdfG/acyl carrier protein
VYRPLPPQGLIHARRAAADGAVNLLLARMDGTVCASVLGYRDAPARPAAEPPAAPGDAPGGLRDKALSWLISTLASELRMDAAELFADAAFEDLGVDSVLSVQLTRTLERRLGDLPKTLFFEYRTPEELADYRDRPRRRLRVKPATRPTWRTPTAKPRRGGRAVLVISTLASELRWTPPNSSPTQRSRTWRRFGASVQLTRTLERRLGDLPKTLLFDSPTPDQPADYLGTAHAAASGENPPGVPVATAPAAAPAAAPVDIGDGIAVIGLAGRFPKADTLEQFWRNLCAGLDCIEEIPLDRFDWRHLYNPDKGRYGSIYAKWGSFLSDVDKFDPGFFRIPPRTAAFMDPQERLFMEAAPACIEAAGIAPEALCGRSVGVYAGTMYGDYQFLGVEETQRGNPLALYSFHASVSNRVSHALDLIGPSMTLDTMCSSSLTALHLACNAIRGGECDLAIAGGVNLTLHQNKQLLLSQGRFLSTDGRCRSFGEGGDGYVPGEGVAAVLLKPLAAAIADRDPIWGVIRGSALTHGGRVGGYSVPSPDAQAAAISAALKAAAVDPADITYVEAHGTGTALGDPIEINGMIRALGPRRDGCPPRAIGAVKSNIGHLEGASGIAGLTKVLLQMDHGELVPSLHSERLNPNIDFSGLSLRVLQGREPWPRLRRDGVEMPRSASVSAFGAGGSNAHVLVEESPLREAPRGQPPGRPAIVVLSARADDRLAARARDLLRWLETRDDDPWLIHDVAFTLQVGRDAMEERVAFVVADRARLRARLEAFANGDGGDWRRGSRVEDRADARAAAALATGDAAALAAAWADGARVDWRRWHGDAPLRRLHLPTYPFARERYWPELTAGPATVAPPAADLDEMFWQTRWRIAPPVAAPAISGPLAVVAAPGDAWAAALAAAADARLVTDRAIPGDAAGIIVTPPPVDDNDPEAPARAVLDLAAILRPLLTGQAAVWVGTRGARRVADGEVPSPTAAALSGMARVAAREATARLTVIDVLPGDSPAELAPRLLAEPAQRDGQDIALRRGGRWQLDLAPLALPDGATPWRRGGHVLIVGGNGGIGFALSRHLAERCGARLTWIGRRAADDALNARIAEIRAAGGDVLYLSADAADAAAMTGAVAAAVDRFGEISVAVHSAMVLRDGTLARLSDADILAAFEVKARGSLALVRALWNRPLDALLFMSSVAAISASAGQANYVAGGGFIDALTQSLQGRAPWPVKVIDWGYWGSVGGGTDPEIARRMAAQSVLSIEPPEGMRAIERALAATAHQVVALKIAPEAVRRMRGEAPAAPKPSAAPGPADPTQRVRQIFAEIMGMSAASLDPARPLTDYGADSLVLMDAMRRLEQDFGPLPPGLAGAASIAEVAQRLGASAAPAAPMPSVAPPEPPVPRPAADPNEDEDRFPADARCNRMAVFRTLRRHLSTGDPPGGDGLDAALFAECLDAPDAEHRPCGWSWSARTE